MADLLTSTTSKNKTVCNLDVIITIKMLIMAHMIAELLTMKTVIVVVTDLIVTLTSYRAEVPSEVAEAVLTEEVSKA